MRTVSLIETDKDRLDATKAQLHHLTPQALRDRYHLDTLPGYLLFDTLLERGPLKIYPFHAILPTTYQLERVELANNESHRQGEGRSPL
ncbi:MAG: hypothetical protein C0621_04025 [Desulfuromonas sp.]|nr:MAG: hypothetical protein C0621_04025 [Desulfuromonas sp.]